MDQIKATGMAIGTNSNSHQTNLEQFLYFSTFILPVPNAQFQSSSFPFLEFATFLGSHSPFWVALAINLWVVALFVFLVLVPIGLWALCLLDPIIFFTCFLLSGSAILQPSHSVAIIT